MRRYFSLINLLFFGHLIVFGEYSFQEIRIGFIISSDSINLSLKDNAAHIQEIISIFDKIKADSTVQLSGVTFSGYASPDGRFKYNKQLSKARTAAIEKYVRDRVAIPDSVVTCKSGGIAWDILAREIAASDMPHKDEAMRVLRDVPEFVYDNRGRLVDSRKRRLMMLQYGRTWHYMKDHFFDNMRYAGIAVSTTKSKPPASITPERTCPAMTADTVVATMPFDADTAAVAPDSTTLMPAARKPFYMSVKTNMLYDALALPNIGVEFYLGKAWSITANWMYGWWDNDSRHRYWRAYGGDIAVRKWFGKAAADKPLTGHHLGLYGQVLTYDFEFGGKGQMAGEPGEPLWKSPSYAVGVEYGYSLPISRQLNIDFTIGIGYLRGKYYEYEPIDNHYVWQATKQRNWFGPTKAEISLVWLLGHGNNNTKKGNK